MGEAFPKSFLSATMGDMVHAPIHPDRTAETLKRYLQTVDSQIFGDGSIQDFALERIKGGLHNANYLVTFPRSGNRYVVRFSPDAGEGSDPIAAEYHKVRQLDFPFVPTYLHLDKPGFINGSLVIMEFVEGEHKPYDRLSDEEISAWAGVMARLHGVVSDRFHEHPAGPLVSGTKRDCIGRSVEQWVERPLRAVRFDIYPDAQNAVRRGMELLQNMLAANGRYFQGSAFSFLHGDPGPSNLLWNDRGIVLIDWTESGFGDPADEISFMFAVNQVGERFEKVFLESYLRRRADEGLQARIEVYRLKNHLADLAWALERLEQERLGKDHALLRLEEGERKRHYALRLEALRRYLDRSGLVGST